MSTLVAGSGRSVGRTLRHTLTGLSIYGPLWMVELVVLTASFFVAFVIRYGGRVPSTYSGPRAFVSLLLITISYSVASVAFRAYRSVWRFVTVRDMVTLALTVATSVTVVGLVELTALRDDRPIPLSTLLIGGTLAYLSLTHLKLASRLRHSRGSEEEGGPLVVIGAGTSGAALARRLKNHAGQPNPVAFIDDDRRKIGRWINGLPVVGGRASIAQAVQRYEATAVAIAIPSASAATIRELSLEVSSLGVPVLVMPRVHERIGSPNNPPLRQISLEDLFGRAEVGVNPQQIQATFRGKRVMVTGAAGSIGSEIARQVAHLFPSELILVDNNETGLTDLRDELTVLMQSVIRVLSVTDRTAIDRAFCETHPEVVIHAAAMKHVDVVEEQPHEAAHVNVIGTAICIRSAEKFGAELFLLISTDKAVDPSSVLGASKRIGEHIVTSGATSRTTMIGVRFGNVLGSRGSVVPRFERQIAAGGPLTLTHPDVHRYFMSIPEAVRLVLQSAAFGRPGRMYVLDMGEEVSIRELAIRLAGLRGARIPEDIEIVYTGLRPGERLREQLVQPGEQTHPTEHPQIRELIEGERAAPTCWVEAVDELELLLGTANRDVVREQLLSLALDGPSAADSAPSEGTGSDSGRRVAGRPTRPSLRRS